MACQKSARARRGLAHPKAAGGGVNEPDPPLATAHGVSDHVALE